MTTSATTSHQATIQWNELGSIVPAGDIAEASVADAIDGVVPGRVVRPNSVEQISQLLKWASETGVKVAPRGSGSKLGWGNMPAGVDLVLSLEKMTGVVEHVWEDMTVTVRAGNTIAQLQAELGKHRQSLALDPLWPERATVGGVIAANDSGSRRIRCGSIRDLILGATVVLANGTVARSGGKVVKNVAGYDLPKLMTGSFGTLGVIAEATFRLYPVASVTRTVTFKASDIASANGFVLAVADSTLVPTGLQIRVQAESAVVNVRFEGLQEGIDAQVAQARQLADGAALVEGSEEVWRRESLFSGGTPAVVGKFSVLPTRIAETVKVIQSRFPRARMTVQSTGIGLFRGECDSAAKLAELVAALRKDARSLGGSLVFLDLPSEVKKTLDVFGAPCDSHPLMIRVKQRFDPMGTLNPGRFLGGI